MQIRCLKSVSHSLFSSENKYGKCQGNTIKKVSLHNIDLQQGQVYKNVKVYVSISHCTRKINVSYTIVIELQGTHFETFQ